MAISDGTIIRLVASMLFPDSVIAQNVFHIIATDLSGGNDPDDVVLDMEEYTSKLFNDIESYYSNLITAGELKVYEYDPLDEDFDEIGTGLTQATPAGGEELLPHGVALVQNYYTTNPDIQGRKFWAGQCENVSDDGIWAAVVLTAFIGAAGDLVSTFVAPTSSNEYQPVVWSPTNLVAVPYTGIVATNAIPGYQRRRKPGVGI